MAKELKFLYETSVLKQLEEKVTETKEEGGEKVEIVRTIKKSKPVKVAILEPRRKLFEGSEIFFAKQIAHYLQIGLLPRSLVEKRYANDGGALSEPDKNNLKKLKEEEKELQLELYTISGEEEEEKIKRKNELILRLSNISTEIRRIENAFYEIFENTAEIKARNKTIEWLVLHLSYIDEDEKGLKPLFGEGSYEEKLEKYDELDEKQDLFLNECIRRLSYLITFWFTSGSKISKTDFDSMNQIWLESLSEYKVEDNENIKVNEIK